MYSNKQNNTYNNYRSNFKRMKGYFMENTQIASLTNEMSAVQVLAPYLSGDFAWKSLYSHSYTLNFNCKTCNYQFDIDGWFYKFDSLECPQCKATYSGIFGNILPGSRMDQEIPSRSVLKLESFEGQEINIQLSSIARAFNARQDHIILVIFSKSSQRSNNPWCVVDWSVKNSKAQYFHPISNAGPNNQGKRIEKKSKSALPLIFLGLFSIIGLGSLFLVATNGLQFIK